MLLSVGSIVQHTLFPAILSFIRYLFFALRVTLTVMKKVITSVVIYTKTEKLACFIVFVA